ncbi:aminoglycoside phosphotransferase family protein [Psychrobacillus sp. FSL K6-2836]|uniref:aminoglycoside phosphotransferase family protein n=1 Tax=Psychrobacillus sp. FSL K6-2836 TaxID=2921548 RepID=UPI0030F97BF5
MLKVYSNKNPVIPEQFQKIIGSIQRISYPKRQGATSEVIFLYTDRGNYVCKRSSLPKYRTWLSKEAKVMEVLNVNTALSIPTYYHYVEEENNSFLLMSLEEGIPLREALIVARTDEDKKNLIYSFGTQLRTLHETAPPPHWQQQESWLDIQLKKATYNLKNYEVDGDQPLLDSLKINKPVAIPQMLIHGDCTIDNVLVKDNQVHTFIDLSEADFGDPRYDVALAIRSFLYDEVLLKAFYDGYRLQQISKEEFAYFDGGLYEFF